MECTTLGSATCPMVRLPPAGFPCGYPACQARTSPKSAERPRHSCRGWIGVGRAGLNAQEPNKTHAVPEPLTLQRHLIYSCARSRGNLFILNHLGCAPTVVEPPPPLLRGGGFHFGQRVRARLLVARVMELLNVKLEA